MATVNDKTRIYSLKRRFGRKISILKRISVDVNIETGLILDKSSEIDIHKAIVLWGSLKPKFIYDIGYLAANANFTFGGEHNELTCTIIVTRADLPIGFILESTGRMRIDGKIYNFENIRYDSFTECHIIRGVATGELTNA
jgi:hypothetical protein